MSTTYDIIKGISQAASKSYDGATDDKGEPVKIGLKREEGRPLIDKRVMDGFSVSFHGDQLCVHYHSEMTKKELTNLKDVDGDTASMFKKIVKFLKKEYKQITGNGLSLTQTCDCKVRLEYISHIRCWLTAKQYFKIGGLKGFEEEKSPDDRLDDSIKKWISLGKGAPK
jgi:hypothetical protein